jgi:hypothetical protein
LDEKRKLLEIETYVLGKLRERLEDFGPVEVGIVLTEGS